MPLGYEVLSPVHMTAGGDTGRALRPHRRRGPVSRGQGQKGEQGD